MKGWRAPQPEKRPKQCAPYAQPYAARRAERVEIATRRASSSSERVAPWVLRARDRTGVVRPSSRAIGAVQAPTSARAIRLPGPQTGALRAGGHARQQHRIRGREAINAPKVAVKDAVVARRPTDDSGTSPAVERGPARAPAHAQISESDGEVSGPAGATA